jgi:hypothetical protein
MPDITLYREDIELIRRSLKRLGTHASNILRDKLLDRLVQNLHPSKPASDPIERMYDEAFVDDDNVVRAVERFAQRLESMT